MKNIIIALFAALGMFGLIYLMGCFYANSFNIAHWEEIERGFVAFLGGVLSIILGGLVFISLEDN